MHRVLRALPRRTPRCTRAVRRLSNDKSLEDLVRTKTAAAVAANQPPPPTAEAPKAALVPPDVAHDLCHEVGWEYVAGNAVGFRRLAGTAGLRQWTCWR